MTRKKAAKIVSETEKEAALMASFHSAATAGFDEASVIIGMERQSMSDRRARQVELIVQRVLLNIDRRVKEARLRGVTSCEISRHPSVRANPKEAGYVPTSILRIAYDRILQAINGKEGARLTASTEEVIGKVGFDGLDVVGLRLMLDFSGLYRR